MERKSGYTGREIDFSELEKERKRKREGEKEREGEKKRGRHLDKVNMSWGYIFLVIIISSEFLRQVEKQKRDR